MKKGLLPLFLPLLIALLSCETEGFLEQPAQSEINIDVDRDQIDDTSKTEINILGLDKSIIDGDSTPEELDNTDYKKINIDSSSVSHEFIIKNIGSLDLKLTGSDPYVIITAGANTEAADFILTKNPVNVIAPDGSSTFTIKFDPSTEGIKTATISIANNDIDENPYNFTIKGEGTKTAVVLEPEIDITGLDKSIITGDTTPVATDNTLYSKVNKDNGSVSHEFSVKNTGDTDLELSSNVDSLVVITPGANTNVNDFTITTKPSQTIATNASSKFIIKFDPSSIGVKTATISIANNDADENPYIFTVQGEGTEEPSQPAEIDITGLSQSISDGDTTPTDTDNTDYGSLNVSSGSVSHEFIIKNIGEMDLELTDNDPYVSITPGANTNSSDFIVTTKPVKTITPNGSTKFIIKFDPSSEGIKTGTVSIANNDTDENPYNFTIQGEGATPEMDVLGLDISITDGDTTPDEADNTQYGQTNIATGSISHEFTIKNLGAADLKLTGAYPYVIITPGANTEASEFSLILNPASGIVPDGSTTFIIKFNPSSEGLKTAQISIASDDADENPYNFTIDGEGFDDGTVDPNAPCSFTTNDIAANSTITIDCLLDLGGQTINLPSNVNFDYAGGQIINGTLNFNGGYIEGDLLNYTLGIEGDAVLKSSVFEFVTSRWNIKEGQTTSSIAFNNKKYLQGAIDLTKSMGATDFIIDKLDAYFEVGNFNNLSVFRSVEHAISIPSNFYFKMSDNTHLRVYPNSSSNYALMVVFDSENITIDGGNLYGDRDTHNYTGGAHEHGHCLQIRSGANVVVKNAHFSDGAGDGIDINSVGRSYDPDYNPTTNVTIKANVFDSNRRNNLSITDGRNIIIENNLILNASKNTSYSTGIAPGFAIDIEAIRKRNSAGVLVFDQIAKDIIIRNNIEKGSRAGAFTAAIAYDVLIENNETEGSIGYSFGYGIKIRGNRITAPLGITKGSGINCGRVGGDETIYNNEISGNIISGYPVSLTVYNRDTQVFNNTFKNFTTGVLVTEITNVQFTGNNFESSVKNSKGIFISLTSLNNVTFSQNIINVDGNAFKFSSVNIKAGEESFKFKVEGNIFNSTSNSIALIGKTRGLDFVDNTVNTGIQMFNSIDVLYYKNTITSSNNHGIYVREVNQNITIDSNTIDVPTGFECVKVQSTTNSNEVVIVNNNCQ